MSYQSLHYIACSQTCFKTIYRLETPKEFAKLSEKQAWKLPHRDSIGKGWRPNYGKILHCWTWLSQRFFHLLISCQRLVLDSLLVNMLMVRKKHDQNYRSSKEMKWSPRLQIKKTSHDYKKRPTHVTSIIGLIQYIWKFIVRRISWFRDKKWVDPCRMTSKKIVKEVKYNLLESKMSSSFGLENKKIEILIPWYFLSNFTIQFCTKV